MTDLQTDAAPDQKAHKSRHCAECGKAFVPAKPWQSFCELSHQQRFHDTMAKRGKVAVPFMMAWRRGKNGRTEDSAYGFDQMAALADRWAAEDKLAGRDATRVVSRKRKEGWRAADLR